METTLKRFLKINNLKQRELALYLDITDAAISNMVNGKSNPSEDNLIKLINNEHGWDISPLVGGDINADSGTYINHAGHDNFFTPEQNQSGEFIGLLRKKDEQIDRLLSIIEKLSS